MYGGKRCPSFMSILSFSPISNLFPSVLTLLGCHEELIFLKYLLYTFRSAYAREWGSRILTYYSGLHRFSLRVEDSIFPHCSVCKWNTLHSLLMLYMSIRQILYRYNQQSGWKQQNDEGMESDVHFRIIKATLTASCEDPDSKQALSSSSAGGRQHI